MLGTPRSPIGVYTDMLLEAGRNHFGQNWYAAVTDHVISWEVSARLLRMRVEMGAADASIIYEPDAKTGRGLRTLNIPSPCAIEATYFAAAGLGRSGRGAPQRLIEVLASSRARAAFMARGFRPI